MPDSPEARRGGPRRVAGLAIRTSNAAEAEASTARIPDLWHRFTNEDWFSRLEQFGAVGPILAVYYDYATDVSGPYQLLVGREVAAPTGAPAGVVEVEVPGGAYLVFRCVGQLPGAVIAGWRGVWDFFGQPNAPARAYTADLEIYGSGPVAAELWIATQPSPRISL
jgi:predicted transcriptional regulator YdeE